MLTPQEVAEHSFHKASFGGYNMAMVDEFLDLLTADYTTLYKENATLKAKMKVLADKIEEYRSTEDSMRKAMLSAQKMADQMVAEAEAQAAAIVTDAEAEAKKKIESIRQEVESERLRLTAAQNATAAYIAKLKDLYENERLYLASLSKLTATPPPEDPVAQTAEAIGEAVGKAVEEVGAPAPAAKPEGDGEDDDDEPTIPRGKPAEKPLEEDSLYQELRRGVTHEEEKPAVEPPVSEPTRRIDLKNLKFGKDYEIE